MSASYLVQYGKFAYLGQFVPGDGASYSRGDCVVIAGPRGNELGQVLCEPEPRFTDTAIDGELVRLATSVDRATSATSEAKALDLLDQARSRIEALSLPMEAIDVEVSLDGRTAILHGLAWRDCDATPILEELSDRYSVILRFLDLASAKSAEPEPSGCGKSGCGSTGGGCNSCGSGGCSSKSCSSGKVTEARELTAYFADLRRQMESTSAGRVPLV